jgi:hypothetical protein
MITLRTINKPRDKEFSVSGLSNLPELGYCVDLLAHLSKSLILLKMVISRTSEDRLLYSYGPHKWTVCKLVFFVQVSQQIADRQALSVIFKEYAFFDEERH